LSGQHSKAPGFAGGYLLCETAEGSRATSPAIEGDDRTTATILAALRFYQMRGLGDAAVRDIATNFGLLVALDAAEIDSLCERLNLG
jgi:hypothetical protein